MSSPASSARSQASQLSYWSQRLIVLLIHALLICVPFFFTWVNEELFEFNKMVLTYAGVALIGCLWITRMIVEERLIFRRTYLDIPIVLFVISQVLSTIFSIHPYTSIFGYYTRFHGGLLSTLTYVLLYYAFVSNVPRSHLPKLLLTLSLSALGVSLYAIPEHFGHSPSCFLITEGQQFDVSCWIQDVKNRVFGTFGQPNWIAAYAITILPVTTALALSSWKSLKSWQKVLYVTCTIALFMTLIYTRSRSGLLGLGFGGVIFGVGLAVTLYKKRLELSKVALPLGLIGLFLGGYIIIFGTIMTPSVIQLFQSRSPEAVPAPAAPVSETAPAVNRLEEGGTQSGEIRRIVWNGAIAVGKRYPLFGSGVETFAYSYYQDRPVEHNLVSEWDFLYNKAHNEFLNYFATTGVVGLATYCLLLGWFLFKAAKYVCNSNDGPSQLLVVGLASGIVALTVSNALGFSTVMVTILMFLYFGILELILKPEPEAATSQRPNKVATTLQATHYVGLSLTGLVALYCLWTVITMWTADRGYAQAKLLLRSGETAAGLDSLQRAIIQSPSEALYYDELSSTYASLAVQYAQINEATTAGQLAQAAITSSDRTLELNDRHLNFYKTRARVFITLAQLKQDWLNNAKDTLMEAIALAPTDAKLMYNLALVQLALDEKTAGLETLQKTIAMKPNYEAARVELARNYEEAGQYELAKAEYHYILENITPNNELVRQKLITIEASQSGQRPETP